MKTKVYVHGDKNYMYEKGEALGLTGEALSRFRHACTEIELVIDVDKTGDYKVITIDGRAIA